MGVSKDDVDDHEVFKYVTDPRKCSDADFERGLYIAAFLVGAGCPVDVFVEDVRIARSRRLPIDTYIVYAHDDYKTLSMCGASQRALYEEVASRMTTAREANKYEAGADTWIELGVWE